MSQRILVADDDRAARTGLASLLSRWGYEVAEAANGTDALEQASRFRPSVVVADLVMPGLDGIELVKPLAETVPEAVVVLLTAHASVETAVSAMKEGAYDYLIKPVDLGRLRRLIENAMGSGDGADGAAARPRRADGRATPRLLGKSPLIQEVNRLIEMAAESLAPVLISGETGTGKELVARTIHELSPRARAPFVAVNCSAVPETLLESELFGFERGAFTGAANRRAGYFELADGGTLFLDEIAEMSPTLQARYLRILQEGIVRRLGGASEIRVDVRVVSASNKDTASAVKDGSLREDLYYRLNVLHIPVPPLRRRRGDIPLLVEAFIAEFNERYGRRVQGVEEAAMTLLDAARVARQRARAAQRAGARRGDVRVGADRAGGALPALHAGGQHGAPRGGPARGHHHRGGRARPHPEDARVGEQQQDARRGDPRHHPQDAPQQGATLEGPPVARLMRGGRGHA